MAAKLILNIAVSLDGYIGRQSRGLCLDNRPRGRRAEYKSTVQL